ncbi:MAG TPA: di-heme oxidoredictase family protein [Pirellulales bacterium]|nr:di-heme oxidoredictase family protein [Pirellulales bacterium]
MRRTGRVCGCAVAFAVVALWGVSAWGAAKGSKSAHADRGQELFEHVWLPGKDPQAAGDGLGPLFNERSCIACHHLGGIGGGGPNQNNVVILTAVVPGEVASRESFQARLLDLHPGFGAGNSVVLHRFSANAPGYAAFRRGLLGAAASDEAPAGEPPSKRTIVPKDLTGPVKTLEVDGIELKLAERNTTPLFGAVLIDAIPQAEIERIAVVETLENPQVHGRFVGRFGWRGQLLRLAEFMRGACANELGLQVSTDAQAIDPSAARNRPPHIPEFTPLDLTDKQCNEMTLFVSRLPMPRRVSPADHREAAAAHEGEHVFRTVGCAVCHRPALGKVKGIYSDLLVHAMGSRLADPMPSLLAAPVATPRVPMRSSYIGAPPPESSTPVAADSYTRLQEWKTPPLWGLRDSGPYLHDGRAATVEEAITFHGGEASDSADRYLALSSGDRDHLLAFLQTLAAPDPATLPPLKQPAEERRDAAAANKASAVARGR